MGSARTAPVAASNSMTPHARRSTVPSIEVRPSQCRDREQLTALVDAHIEAVLPGVAVSVNAVLGQLVGHGADWLRLARAERLIDYVILGEDDAHLAFATALGFRELTRVTRGWSRPVSAAP